MSIVDFLRLSVGEFRWVINVLGILRLTRSLLTGCGLVESHASLLNKSMRLIRSGNYIVFLQGSAFRSNSLGTKVCVPAASAIAAAAKMMQTAMTRRA